MLLLAIVSTKELGTANGLSATDFSHHRGRNGLHTFCKKQVGKRVPSAEKTSTPLTVNYLRTRNKQQRRIEFEKGIAKVNRTRKNW